MNEARARFFLNLRQSIDPLLRVLSNKSAPPPSLGLAFDISGMPPATLKSSALTYGSVGEMIKDFSIVFGVPKYRTSKPKKVTRKFSFTRLLQPIDNLVTCPACSNIHPSDTICDACYSKVHKLTSEIKKKMMEYNPYVGEKQDREVYVKFKGESEAPAAVVKGKRVIELEKDRPTWFKKLTLKE
ncbi:hypothetical protein GCK72_010149 [Caenorhabditis remanei]|uniref:Large ribosomal subunit protein bL32m n=2 Tax=Caenorhabditis remanei TaxID=31234 RepID=E3MI13_CAERE|nr:hypothetical protein GCK72_010149 [Caenorhabditis remanei]EFP02356.1 hypothetical protein CRE_01045 [Caenorhabditis remanei]KAF1761890.1 hypothetical protein GCK72_010149 [Caenorhabditis remanei]